ncbi:hypothetical protein [Azotobacter vinelandii]|uniref:hypothetical protein n=1 Tax=Azotobacter vinelandii TaxID=354 RepID=UPI000923806A|nr:hypothetical protein [Azotobacter vinelandii]SFY30461.1 hypothetical protein SAMN04244547_04996 [Azotobacter vinelandii]
MSITEILSLALACCGLLAIGLYIGEWTRSEDEKDLVSDDVVDDEDLFTGWDWLSPTARRRRLALYQRRVRARIAEQEREWLRARLRECAKG